VNILQDIVQDIVIDFSVVRVTLLGIVQNVPNCSGLFPIVPDCSVSSDTVGNCVTLLRIVNPDQS
jgi:hypothetical protein